MLKPISLIAVSMLVLSLPASADQITVVSSGSTPEEKLICKKVLSAKTGSKPEPLCMTKSQWAAKKIADAKDPNRIVCHYEQSSRSKFQSTKVCMTAVEWVNHRQMERDFVERIQSGVCVKGGGC